MQTLTVSEARERLTSTVREYRTSTGDHEPVIFGSHRRPEAVILPFDTYDRLVHAHHPSLRDEILSKRELVLKIAELNKISSVSIFGSVARGEESPDSDIDFLVSPMPGATHFDLAQFQIDMEQLLGREVDVVSRGALDPERDSEFFSDEVRL